MSEYQVDSDWAVDCLHGRPDANRALTDLAPYGLAVSVITYGELYQGAYYARNAPTDLRALQTFLRGIEILPITTNIMERFAIIRGSLSRQLRSQIGDMDLLIAATALEHDLTLLTRNLRDFQHIPGLKLHQP